MEFNHLLRGASVRSVLLVGNIVVGFFMLPYLIHNLGMEVYGLWLIVGSVIGYFGIMDFGLQAAAQRFLSAAYAKKDREEITRALNTAIVANSILAFLLISIAGLVYAFSGLFFDDQELNKLFDILIIIMSLKFITTMPLAAFNGVVTAFTRHDLAAKVELLKLVLRTSLFIFSIEYGYGVVGVALSMLSTEILGSILIALIGKYLDPEIKVKLSSASLFELKSFFNYGKFSFILNISNMLKTQIDNLVVGKILGLEQVSIYGVATALNRYRQNGFDALIGIFQPTFTKLDTVGSRTYLAEKIKQAFSVALFLSCSTSLVFLTLGGTLIHFWVGAQFSTAYFCLLLFAVNSVVALSTMPLHTYLIASAKHRQYAYVSIVEAGFNVVLSIYFASQIGIAGVALGTVIPSLAVKMFFLIPFIARSTALTSRYFYTQLLKVSVLILVFYKATVYLGFENPTEIKFVDMIFYVFYFPLFAVIFYFAVFDKSVKEYLVEKIKSRRS